MDTSRFGELMLHAKPAAPIAAARSIAGAITVDGELSEPGWLHRGANLPYWLNRVVKGVNNNTARYSLLWDDERLYIGVRV